MSTIYQENYYSCMMIHMFFPSSTDCKKKVFLAVDDVTILLFIYLEIILLNLISILIDLTIFIFGRL